MRVVQVITSFQRRGAEVFAADLSRSLNTKGHVCNLVGLYANVGPCVAKCTGDVELNADPTTFSEALFSPVLAFRLVRALSRLRPDVIQMNGGRAVKYAPFVRLAFPNAVLIYRCIDMPSHWVRSLRARVALPPVVRAIYDGAIAVSGASLADFEAVYGREVRAVAIANGVDFGRLRSGVERGAWRAQVGLLSDVPLICFIGALGPQKRPDLAIDALRRVARRDACLVMIGEGPWRGKVHDLIQKWGLSERVRVLGSRDDVGDALRASDLLWLTSATEGLPAVVIEAMACGVPPIAFDVGGVAEVVDRESGCVVGSGDIGALVASTDLLLADAPRRASMAANGRRRAAEYDIESIAERYLDFFRERQAAG